MKKKKITIYLLLVLVLIEIILVMKFFITEKRDDFKDKILSSISYEEDIDTKELGLTNFLDTATQPEYIDDISRINVINTSVLNDYSFPEYAVFTLEEYLSKYMNYYLNDGHTYEGKIDEERIKKDVNLPYFYLRVDEIDLEIECEYDVCRKTYYFYSRLNPR